MVLVITTQVSGRWRRQHPPTAQHALREGRLIGKNIWSRLEGRQTKTFVYKAPGLLAFIGRRIGVAHLFEFNVSGLVGWVLWRTIYLMKLPRLEKKLRVAINLPLAYLPPSSHLANRNERCCRRARNAVVSAARIFSRTLI
jgi:NADH dehydrogenase FAD-containing subunit